jgi:hypothetical protein
MQNESVWWLKLFVAMAYDVADFTFGRLLVAIPFLSEIVGTALCCALFGRNGLWYMLEALDPTEQIDAFIPTATLIALRSRPGVKPVRGVAEA